MQGACSRLSGRGSCDSTTPQKRCNNTTSKMCSCRSLAFPDPTLHDFVPHRSGPVVTTSTRASTAGGRRAAPDRHAPCPRSRTRFSRRERAPRSPVRTRTHQRVSSSVPFSSPVGAAPKPRASALADNLALFPSSARRSAFPHDQVVHAAAAAGAAGSLGVLAGVYRVRLNRCRCTKAERAEVKQGGALALHCRRCLKRTNKGVFVSFLTSPLYVAGAAVGVAHCAHALGTPMVKGARRVRASRR